jgi:hypothetical protein
MEVADGVETGRVLEGISPKRLGEIAEAAFLWKAERLGFSVAKPWGDSEKYDYIVDSGQRLWRVQLKSTAALHGRGCEVQPVYSVYGEGKAAYRPDEIDVLAAYIFPKDTWYLIPIEDFAPAKNLRFYPDISCRHARWEIYREAWRVFR